MTRSTDAAVLKALRKYAETPKRVKRYTRKCAVKKAKPQK